MSELVMRDRKASRLAGAWLAASVGGADTLAAVVEQAMVEQVGVTDDPQIVAARKALTDIERLASAINQQVIRPASATTWWLTVRKLQAQELARAGSVQSVYPARRRSQDAVYRSPLYGLPVGAP